MRQEVVYYRLRIPVELKNYLEKIAKEKRRSMNGQILVYIDQGIHSEKEIVENEN